MISTSELGRIVAQHHDSLPMIPTRRGLRRHWPWLALFLGLPTGGTLVLSFAKLTDKTASSGLLAGVGVLAGLLFAVLASVSARVARLADETDGQAASSYRIALVTRLDIARANIAYATLVSIVYAVVLGLAAMLTKEPRWLNLMNAFLLLYLGLTLLLVLVRINSIGEDDRVSALTAHARKEAA